MIQGNVSSLCRGSVGREGGCVSKAQAAVWEPCSHFEGLAEWRPKGLHLLGGGCFKVGCSCSTVTFGALSPLGFRQIYNEMSQSQATIKKIPNLLKSIMGCALSCLFS